MRTNRMLAILGLAVAVPVLVASMAFACEKTCSGKTSTASVKTASTAAAEPASAVPAGGKAGCAAKSSCSSKAAAASAQTASSCGSSKGATAKAAGGCGAECAKACCAGKSAAMITYSVAGMTCMGCVKQVEAAVAELELENVEKVEVHLDDANAVVTTNGPVDAVAVANAITKAGFEAKVASAEPQEQKAEETEEPSATM